MTVSITPGAARGAVCAPPSKSCGHRMLLCAALAAGESRIRGISRSQDMAATLDCIRAMGGSARLEGDTAHITGTGGCAAKSAVYPCRESGSTLRFCIPPALVPGGRAVFTGAPRLLERGIGIYEDVLPRAGIRIEKSERCIALEGALTAGEYTLRGDVSSQFISGLLLALPLLAADSTLCVLPPVESRPYIDITLDVMRSFSVQVDEWDENCFFIPGQQHYAARVAAVEGDWSNAAFLLALGEGVTVTGLRAESLQGDRVCRDMLRRLQSPGAQLDLTACPDLGPVLFAAAARAHEESAASVTSILRSPAGCTQDGSRRANIKRKKPMSTPSATMAAHTVTTTRGMVSRNSSIKRYVYGPQNWQTSVPSATMVAARYTIARARLSTRTRRSLQISALEMQNGSHHYKRAGSGALRTRIRLIYSTRLACSLHYAQICTA